jgi:hypothetical protein
MDGFYVFQFVGAGGGGLGALLIENGKVRGFDQGKVLYDGTATPTPNGGLQADVTMTVPPNTPLVGLGLPPTPNQMGYPFKLTLPPNFANGQTIPIMISGRTTQVTFTLMRGP